MQYNYLNARISSRKTDLICSENLNALLNGISLENITDFLLGTRYRPFLEAEFSVSKGLISVLNGISSFLESEIRAVYKIAGTEISQILDLFLGKWDMLNLKTVFSCRVSDRRTKNSRWHPAGFLKRSDCQYLSTCTDSESIEYLNRFSHPFFKKSISHIRQLTADKKIHRFCNMLDFEYFSTADDFLKNMSEEKDVFRQVIDLELDKRNLMEVFLYLTQHNTSYWESTDLYGHLSSSLLKKLLNQKSVEDAMEKLLETKYREEIQNSLLLFEHTGELGFVERLFEKRLLTDLKKQSVKKPLGLAVSLSYLSLLINEYTNLNLLSLGSVYHLNPNLIRREMLFV